MGWIIGLISFVVIIFLPFLLIKNENACKNQLIIADAIYDYGVEMITEGCSYADLAVDFDDMESYRKTLFRLWDWGYKRILPPDKFEFVKPYIKR